MAALHSHDAGYDEDEEYDREDTFTSNEKNSALAVGYKSDRSFVVRGDRIGVFKHTDDDRLGNTPSLRLVAYFQSIQLPSTVLEPQKGHYSLHQRYLIP